MGYTSDRGWSDRHLDAVRRRIAESLLVVSDLDEDLHRATDLRLLTVQPRAIAVRLRREKYEQRYPHDFTIRSRVRSGQETELDKIRAGFADWMFYGYVSAQEEITRWMLLDLDVFRTTLADSSIETLSTLIDNRDGTQGRAFDVRRFPPGLVLAGSRTPPA